MEDWGIHLVEFAYRKFQYVPTVRKEPAKKPSTRIFVSPKSNYTYHPVWPNKVNWSLVNLKHFS